METLKDNRRWLAGLVLAALGVVYLLQLATPLRVSGDLLDDSCGHSDAKIHMLFPASASVILDIG